MMSVDLKKVIYDSIPSTFQVPDTGGTDRTVNCTKIYVNQFDGNTFPVILLNYAISSTPEFEPVTNRVRGVNPDYEEQTIEQFTSNGPGDYALYHGEIVSVNSVTGTVRGGPYTFVEGTDFEVVQPNIIRFGIGGTDPDKGTSVTVDYTHYMIEIEQGIIFNDTLSINVVAKNIKDSYYIPGPRIVDVIAQEIKNYFLWTFDRDDLVVVSVSEIRDLDELEESDFHYRRQFDVTIRYNIENRYTEPRIKTIEKTTEVN